MSSLLSPPGLVSRLSLSHNLDQDDDSLFTNQILDIVFDAQPNQKLGFAVRIDDTKKCLQISTLDDNGEARRVGLKKGDIILAVNYVDIGNNPKIGLEELKKCTNGEEREVRITVCRRIYDHIMIKVQRCGLHQCDGKYYFVHLDQDYDSPIFMNSENNMLLLKANYDVDTGESLWTISDENHNYYFGVSSDLMPPNDSWEPMKNVGKYPSPGLVFYNTTQRLVELEDDSEDDDGDEFIDINYEDYPSNDKRMSKIGLNALNDPSSIIHPHIVYEHMNELKAEDSTSTVYEDDYEWKIKYDELLERYKEEQKNVGILRTNLKDLNSSFYEYWLKDKKKKRENDKLQRRIDDQSKELFEQNKAEMKLINKIKDTTSHSKQISSLYDIDLDQLIADNNREHEINAMNKEINTLKREINDLTADNLCINGLKYEIKALKQENNTMKGLYQEIETLKQENMRTKYILTEEIKSLKEENMDLNERNTEGDMTNEGLKQSLRDLRRENAIVIESKLGLVESTAKEMEKLKNAVNGILRMKGSDDVRTVIRNLLSS